MNNPPKSSTKVSPTAKSRADNSLDCLTKKFIYLLQAEKGNQIYINDAAKMLGVQKRRVYDITNVLQGIELITKTEKNKIKWVAGDINQYIEY